MENVPEAQLRELMDDKARFELFLDRSERVGVIWRSAGKTQRRTHDQQVEELHNSRGLKVQQVTLRRRLRLIVVSGKVDAGRAREAIATLVEKGVMRRDWTVWEKKAEVRVAVPVADPLSVGRLHTFLPMSEQIRRERSHGSHRREAPPCSAGSADGFGQGRGHAMGTAH
ncbi:hypothetical protein OG349_16710 [Streptomyces sp. NBC_01317]|uniref:hypothetical protein n=1 Tax=Streptomyces sp. NBC_01317 TaxID=2903822 RepID=UPI002E13DAE2|nr:hypothetical protein OG349_16710 [Streptomyces sp. NBC_01317]